MITRVLLLKWTWVLFILSLTQWTTLVNHSYQQSVTYKMNAILN